MIFFRKSKHKKNILQFFNQYHYFKKEFPFPCYDEKTLINKNFKLFKLEFLDSDEIIKLNQIFELENKLKKIQHISRNKIITFNNYSFLDNKLQILKDIIYFNNIKFENINHVSINIYKYVFNKIPVYQIFVWFSLNGNNSNEKTSFVFLVKENNLESFKFFVYNEIFKVKNLKHIVENF